MRAPVIMLIALGVIAGAAPLGAQDLKRFDAWIGAWKGTGWSVGTTGKRTEFTLAELVASRVGGTVLLVEGKGAAIGDSGKTIITHDGLVLVYYDAASGRYRWHGHELTSAPVDTDLTFVEGGFAWSITPNGGATRVRFTILIDRERWREVGEVSSDGAHWLTIMEVTLLRQ